MTIKLSFIPEPIMQARSPQYEVTWLIRRLFRAMAQLADRYLRAHGLSAADRAVLEFLYPENELSVPEIATRYQVSRQHVQVTVNALLEDGFLESRPNPRHKRSPLFTLTRVGRELFSKIRTAEAELLDALFADIPIADIEYTRQTLEAMYFHVLKLGESHAPD
jgi:DNA-binding MarR family transcriptional regulator